jgi:hypothetical protein
MLLERAKEPVVPAKLKSGRVALLFLPVVLIPVAFLAAGPWLRTVGGQTVTLVAAAVAAILTMSYANYLSFLVLRTQDEVEKASAGFAAQWGVALGQIGFVPLLMLPAFLEMSTDLVRELTHDPGVQQRVVALAMTFGFCGLVLMQCIGTLVVRALWWRSKR